MKSFTLMALVGCFIFFSSFIVSDPNSGLLSTRDAESPTINHRIELCIYQDRIPVKLLKLMLEIGGVTLFNSEEGSVYLTAPYTSESEAIKDLPMFRAVGFKEATQVIEINNELFPLATYHILNNDQINLDGKEMEPVIRIWK